MVGGGGGGGDDVHANATCVFFLICPPSSNRFGGHFRIFVAWLSTRRPCKNLAFLQLSRQKLRK